jgi:hypothetical protein
MAGSDYGTWLPDGKWLACTMRPNSRTSRSPLIVSSWPPVVTAAARRANAWSGGRGAARPSPVRSRGLHPLANHCRPAGAAQTARNNYVH